MFKPGEHHREKYFERIRRVKRILRPLPRRATVHNYPVLKWFAETARKRNYLWSFKRNDVVVAIYAGCIISILPIYGIQIGAAFVFALLLRCNLMVMVAAQLITNPITAGPIYFAAGYIGLKIFWVFGADIPHDSVWDFATLIAENLKQAMLSMVGSDKAKIAMEQMAVETGMSLHQMIWLGFRATFVGGAILGYFTGFVFSLAYQLAAKRYEYRHPKHTFTPPVDPVDRGDAGKTVPFPREDSA